MLKILKSITRRKPIDVSSSETKLKRCLGIVDLTALGIGSTLGVGIYVIIGTVAAKQAGPSVVLSFAIAAVSSIFAGFCYAEFGALVPKAGSAYIYSYICVGELMAFVIGWNLILEYVIGTASVARSYANYVDFLFDNAIERFFSRYLSLPASVWFSSYPDLFAFGLTMLLTGMLAIGVQESTRFTTIFTGVNILVIAYCVIVGLFKVKGSNWAIDQGDIPAEAEGGSGGFFPFGIKGTISGAATCFYSYVGFDAVATTGEEVLRPQRDLPIAIVLSLLVITAAYCSVAAVQTLMWPYYEQNVKAPLPFVFEQVGLPMAKTVITVGALAGLSTSLLGAMFPLPRILYAMATDGLLFRPLGAISARFKTPLVATAVAGLFSALMATFFDVDQLAEMMSIGTLLAYSLVAISILILRYKEDDMAGLTKADDNNASVAELENNGLGCRKVSVLDNNNFAPAIRDAVDNDGQNLGPPQATGFYDPHRKQSLKHHKSFFSRLLNLSRSDRVDAFTSKLSISLISFICLVILLFNGVMFAYEDALYAGSLPPLGIVLISLTIFLLFVLLLLLSRQPMVVRSGSFKVPLVPLLPLLSVFTNTYLMVHLNVMTWLRFAVWMALGLAIYFAYGVRNSVGYKLSPSASSELSLPSPPPSLPRSSSTSEAENCDADDEEQDDNNCELGQTKRTKKVEVEDEEGDVGGGNGQKKGIRNEGKAPSNGDLVHLTEIK